MNLPQSFGSVETAAQLYDLLHERFGIGDFDEDQPHWKARGLEITKLKSAMRRRKLNVEAMLLAVWFADRRKLPITATWQLVNLVPEARRAYRDYLAEEHHRDLQQRLNAAAALAHTLGEEGWFNRLLAADMSTGVVVLSEWETALAERQP